MRIIIVGILLVVAGCQCGSPTKPPGWVVQEQGEIKPSIYVFRKPGAPEHIKVVTFSERTRETVIAYIDCKRRTRNILNRKLYRKATALYHQLYPQKSFRNDIFASCP